MVKVLYARHYARLVFDRELHDRLLNEVIEAQPDVPGYTLGNTLAQQQARELLDSGRRLFLTVMSISPTSRCAAVAIIKYDKYAS